MIPHLFSCEHATCAVPRAYSSLFQGSEELVSSAAGWDPGALNLAQAFAMRFRTPLVHSDVTRLLLDVEQLGEGRWSDLSSKLPEASRHRLAERHQQPYWSQLHQRIQNDIKRDGRVLHVMVQTRDNLDGQVMLETPANSAMADAWATAWRARMERDGLRIRHRSDAMGSPLSRELSEKYPADCYAQIRLQVSQSFFLMGMPWRWATIKKHLLDSLWMSSSQLSANPHQA